MAARFILVSATDDTYLQLTLDLLRALRRLKFSVQFDIGILDVGLSEASKAQLAPFGVIIKAPGVDVEYPGRVAWEKQAPYYRAMTSRPFLRDYFQGYESYMWVDADSWPQTAEAIETLLPAAAPDPALFIASELDRDYQPYFQSAQPWEYHLKWYRAHFPDAVINKFFPRPMLNCGVFALSQNSPVWERWAATLTQCLQSLPELKREHFMSEQLSLNAAVYTENLPLKVMPTEYNWLTLYRLPMLDETTGLYVRPGLLHMPLSIVHLTHQGKLQEQQIATVSGKTITRALTFSAV